MFGGVLSLLSIFLIVGYFGMMLKELDSNESTIKSIVSYKDYTKESKIIQAKDFDVAILILTQERFDPTRFLSFDSIAHEISYKTNKKGEYSEMFINETGVEEGDCHAANRMHNDEYFKDQLYMFEHEVWYCPDQKKDLKLRMNYNEFHIYIDRCNATE